MRKKIQLIECSKKKVLFSFSMSNQDFLGKFFDGKKRQSKNTSG